MINTSSPYQSNVDLRLKKEEPAQKKSIQTIQPTQSTTIQQSNQTLPNNVDRSVVAMMRALAQHESGNRAVLPQEKGIGGASIYQYTTDTWKGVAQKYLGDANAPLTRANENKATYYRIKEWKDTGYKPAQIASMWNAGEGEPDAYTGKFSSGKPSIGTNDYGVNYNVPAHAQSVISKFQNELTKIKSESPTASETTEPLGSQELKTEQTYFDKMKANSPLFKGGELALKGITKGIELADKAFRPTIGRAAGYAVEQLGTGIGGAVGLVAGTGKEIYDFAKGGKFSVSDIGKAIEKTATETGKFGREIGTEGGVAAPFAGLGKIPSALVAAPSLYEGTKKMIQTKGQEGKTELAVGFAGLLGAKLSTGAWIDDPLKAIVKSGVNSPISKTTKITDDIRNGYRSVLRPGKGEIMNIEVRQGKSIDNIIDFIAEEGVVIKSTPDGKMDTLEAIDFLKQKQQEPNRVLNEILSTDKTKKFDLMESAEKAFKELEDTVKNADELNARKKEVLEFIQAEIERNGRYVDATTLNNIKSGMWSVGYNMGKPTSQSTARKLGHIMKESIEQNFPDQNIRNLNNLTGQYADALYMLKQAEGRVVPKGAIGQYVAQAIGAMAGSSVPLVGPLAGGWIGGKVGKYLASPERVTSKLMQKAQQAGIPKRSETIMKESIDAATKAKLQPKLPPLLEAGKSQSGAIQLPPISDTGKALQSAKSYVTAVPAEVTTGRNVGTGQFKEVYKSTPKLPPNSKGAITPNALFGGATALGLGATASLIPAFKKTFNKEEPTKDTPIRKFPVANKIDNKEKIKLEDVEKLKKKIVDVESSGGTDDRNRELDAGKYGWLVGFTKGTYNDIVRLAKTDKRYKELLSKIDLDTEEGAKNSAVEYMKVLNNRYDIKGNIIGQEYDNWDDVYLKLYNATGNKEVEKNWNSK